MQTLANRHLIDLLASLLKGHESARPEVLNIGAGGSVFVEDQLVEKGCSFVCDHVDVENKPVNHPNVRSFYHCPVESMEPVRCAAYDLAFSNYLLEHVQNLDLAASEIFRVLRPGAMYVATVPNPMALEFQVSKRTPLWFHRFVRGRPAWKTYYSYKSIRQLLLVLGGAGLEPTEVAYYPCVETFLDRFPVVNACARAYDGAVSALKLRGLMGSVCVALRKPGETTQKGSRVESNRQNS